MILPIASFTNPLRYEGNIASVMLSGVFRLRAKIFLACRALHTYTPFQYAEHPANLEQIYQIA